MILDFLVFGFFLAGTRVKSSLASHRFSKNFCRLWDQYFYRLDAMFDA